MISEKNILRGWPFFTVVVHICIYQNSQQIRHTKKCVTVFPILSALNYYLHVYLWFLEIWTITYLQKEGINFKIFWKENYAIALNSCCLFTKKLLNMELNIILCLWSLHALDILELYDRFDEYLANY